jgi:hypothetical protein
MRRFLSDPLLHFAALGLAFFAGFLLLNDDSPEAGEIIVSNARQQQLVAAFSRVWRRPPDSQELKGLIDDWVREEMANREALAMGLAENDAIIRRRLRMKYESFVDQIAASVEPTPEDLQAWYQSHIDEYREDARYSLSQRFFSSDRREDARGDAGKILATLADAGADIDPGIGDALAMPQTFRDNRESELRNRFGEEFAKALASQPTQRWVGPIPSAYGYHLLYISDHAPARTPALAEIEATVSRDWRDTQLREARDAVYEQLLGRYSVEFEPMPQTQAESD